MVARTSLQRQVFPRRTKRLLRRDRRVLARCLSAYGYRDKNYLTEDGVVEGAWIFCRHGDRVPGRCLTPAHRQADEAAFWMSKLPHPDSAAAFETFSQRFPLEIHPGFNQGQFIDTVRNPFGFLTQKGLEQLNDNGHRFFDRYNRHGHHFPDQKEWRYEVAGDFLSVWDVTAFSTNYLRTVMSVQSFLDGLLGTNLLLKGERSHDPSIHRELRIPNHSWRRPHNTEPLVKVQVRDVSNDPLNAFDRNPDLIADLVGEVMRDIEFQKHDGGVAPLAARLANTLPGLIRKRRSDFSSRSPSGINWVEASDHFVCRQAHDVEYSRFTDFDHDDRIEQTMAAMAHPTLTHLAWRFRQWYQNKRLLAVIAAPPLREVANQIVVTPELLARERHPFVIYSCHDITILGLLYGIGADFLADDRKPDWRYWPGYASTLTFELVRIQDGPMTEDSHLVRVLLNDRPVITAELQASGKKDWRKLVHTGNGPENMLLVDDFVNTVARLEDEGGFDYDSLLGRK